jgi:FkbM family methyltransferase
MFEKLKWLATRPRAVLRAWWALGFRTTVQLALIRMRSARNETHELRILKYPHPVTIRGGQSTDAWAIYELLVMQEYALVGDLDSPSFIIDGGANIGIASLYFLNRFPTAHVVAVEPHPGNFELLRQNLSPYAPRVTLIQGAIWKSGGHLDLDLGQEEWRTSVRAASDGRSGSVEAFPLTALLAHGNGKVDLLKLDIEGSESEIFGPEAQEWLPTIQNIAIELHSKLCSDRFFGALKGYEYELRQHHKDNVVICRNIRPSLTNLIPNSLQA